MIIDEIKSVLDFERQMIVSVAAGVTFDLLNTYLTKNTDFDCLATPTIFRIMPNTAIEVMSSMTFVSARNASKEQTDLIIRIFNELGNAMLVEERLMAAGNGIGLQRHRFRLALYPRGDRRWRGIRFLSQTSARDRGAYRERRRRFIAREQE